MDTLPPVVGYLDRLSFRPGERITLFASGDGGTVDVDLVRLRRGPAPTGEAITPVEPVPWEGARALRVSPQTSCVGSFLAARSGTELDSRHGFRIGGWFFPTLIGTDRSQTLVYAHQDDVEIRISLASGALAVTVRTPQAETTLSGTVLLRERTWSLIEVLVEAGTVTATLTAGDPLYGTGEQLTAPLPEPVRLAPGAAVEFAGSAGGPVVPCAGYARGVSDRTFEGKIAYPFVVAGPAPIGRGSREELVHAARVAGGTVWDLAPQRTGASRWAAPVLAGTGEPAVLVNLPTQGVTGPEWDGTVLSFRESSEAYSAAHFHSTDLVDAGWDPALTAQLPEGLDSGVYGVRLRAADGAADIVPFFVAPAAGAPRKPVLVVMPTFTYLAYGNEDLVTFFSEIEVHRLHDDEVLDIVRSRQVYHGREFGASLYDRHPDGSGVHFSSSLRPLLDMRPDYRFWAYESGTRGFPADLYLIEWLERFGYETDVITDLEIHTQGTAALEGYEVVLTGSHPEYHSGAILDAFTAYRDGGGKLGYLGGNGFYWVTGLVNDVAPVVEIRRGHVGIRTWESEPGEVDLVSSWEPGGLWRFRGRAPQRLVGVGMGAQGGQSRPYHLADGEVRTTHAWFYRGLDGDTVGERGWVGGAAAGDELDRVDAKLGTPPGTVVLAASKDHPLEAQRAAEELLQMFHGSASGPNDPEVRADMTYFETPGGGAVFSASAIAFIASLLVDEGENTSSRALRNVLDHFLGGDRG